LCAVPVLQERNPYTPKENVSFLSLREGNSEGEKPAPLHVPRRDGLSSKHNEYTAELEERARMRRYGAENGRARSVEHFPQFLDRRLSDQARGIG